MYVYRIPFRDGEPICNKNIVKGYIIAGSGKWGYVVTTKKLSVEVEVTGSELERVLILFGFMDDWLEY
jgi:hypothetical protein